ncbi:16543_t:CDS:2 [Entrophospora sp. SA101]|nr:16543_t:CDS:2 [Entrophospora sp. SA101]
MNGAGCDQFYRKSLVNCCRITQDSSLANAEQKEHSAENQLKAWILELRQKGMAAELNLK